MSGVVLHVPAKAVAAGHNFQSLKLEIIIIIIIILTPVRWFPSITFRKIFSFSFGNLSCPG